MIGSWLLDLRINEEAYVLDPRIDPHPSFGTIGLYRSSDNGHRITVVIVYENTHPSPLIEASISFSLIFIDHIAPCPLPLTLHPDETRIAHLLDLVVEPLLADIHPVLDLGLGYSGIRLDHIVDILLEIR